MKTDTETDDESDPLSPCCQADWKRVEPWHQRTTNGGIALREVYECTDSEDNGLKVQVRASCGGEWRWAVIGRVATLDSGERPRKRQAFRAGLAALAAWKLRLTQPNPARPL